MNLTKYELQPEDVEKFCFSCRLLLLNNIDTIHLHYDKEQKNFHVNKKSDYFNTSFRHRKLTIKEIFLINILL